LVFFVVAKIVIFLERQLSGFFWKRRSRCSLYKVPLPSWLGGFVFSFGNEKTLHFITKYRAIINQKPIFMKYQISTLFCLG